MRALLSMPCMSCQLGTTYNFLAHRAAAAIGLWCADHFLTKLAPSLNGLRVVESHLGN